MKKILMIISLVVLVLAVGFFGYYWFLVKGTIKVSTDLVNTKIYVDDNLIGLGSMEKAFRRGNHMIRLEAEGYSTFTKTIALSGWQKKEWSAKMDRLPEAREVQKSVTTLERDGTKSALLLAENNGGDFVRLNPKTGKSEQLSRVDFGKTVRTQWSPDNFLAYVWRSDNSSGLVDLKRYDLLNQEFSLGKKGVKQLGWKADGTEVVFVYQPGDGEFSLVKATPLGENMERLVFHLDKEGMRDPKVEWTKDGDDLLIWDKDVYMYNFYSHKLSRLTKTTDLIEARLSFSGKYVVYTNSTGTYVSGIDGKKATRLGDTFELFEWLTNGEEIIGIKEGEVRKINVQTGKNVEYGYNGEKIKDLKALTILTDEGKIYYLSGTTLKTMELQRKLISY